MLSARAKLPKLPSSPSHWLRLPRNCIDLDQVHTHMGLGQNLIVLVNIKIACKWVFTPLILIIIGFDTHPYMKTPLQLPSVAPNRSSMQLPHLSASEGACWPPITTGNTSKENGRYINDWNGMDFREDLNWRLWCFPMEYLLVSCKCSLTPIQ